LKAQIAEMMKEKMREQKGDKIMLNTTEVTFKGADDQESTIAIARSLGRGSASRGKVLGGGPGSKACKYHYRPGLIWLRFKKSRGLKKALEECNSENDRVF
jgi:hypothetical protein